MRFIPVSDPNKASYGISTGLKYACHVPMACGTTSHFSKSTYHASTDSACAPEHVRNAVEIVTIDDLGDSGSCRSGISGLLQARFGQRERGGWHSAPNLLNNPQCASAFQPPSNPQSPAPNSLKRPAGGPQGSEFRATGLRQCWSTSKARQMTITRLEWYESLDGAGHFILFLLAFPPTLCIKDIWLRLERRSRHSGLKSVAGRAKTLVGQSPADDIALVSCNKADLLGSENEKFTLKEATDESIPFSFVLDVLDLAHKNLSSNANDSWLYAAFVMNAIHQFCEPVCSSSDNRSSTQSNNPHRILRGLADHRLSSGLKHEIALQHDWELLDLENL
ncbi:hypothetical protein FRC08_006384 [Ceratobasidium sp. 394]|nr:hypothetical protein FRC08_006384 [Ceratobasidium sp. 394]KAG9093910.1 hypothetical protein FS749_013513 [Ceratobasidium sp. UAMH 11750]